MNPINVTLAWPPRELSPNARLHWRTVAPFKKAYKESCWALCLNSSAVKKQDPSLRFHVHLDFVPPDRRLYDRDNLIARMKSGLDGVAEALGINDRQFTTLTAKVSENVVGGMVKMTISLDN